MNSPKGTRWSLREVWLSAHAQRHDAVVITVIRLAFRHAEQYIAVVATCLRSQRLKIVGRHIAQEQRQCSFPEG